MTWDNTGTTWPRGATIVRVPRGELKKIRKTFDNEMTVCIDGIEVIRAYSSLIPTGNLRKNRLVSQSGEEGIDVYKTELSNLFEIAGRKQIPKAIRQKLNKALPDIGVIKEWIKSPEPEV